MSKKSVPFSQDPFDVRLTKSQVIGRLAEGVYWEYPEQWVPDATGYILDKWQNELIRSLLIGGNAKPGATILDWEENKKARLSCKASHGTGKCLPLNEKIVLSCGDVVRCGDLVGSDWFLVPSVDENLRIVHAKAWASDNGIQPVWKVTLQDGREITRTENHPLLHVPSSFKAGKDPIFGKETWVAVSELRVGDLVCVPEYLPVGGVIDIEEWKVALLGHLIGDGCFRGLGVSYTQNPGRQLDEVRQIVESRGLRLVDSGNSGYRISGERFGPNEILTFIKDLGFHGFKSEDKYIPECIWKASNDKLRIFLSRLFGADGWAYTRSIGKKKNGENKLAQEIGYVSKSERLVRDVHLALLRFGISGKIKRVKKSWTYKGIKKWGNYWTWTVTDCRNVLRFIDRVGIYGKEEACEKVRISASRDFDPNRKSGDWINGESRALKWPYHNLPDGFRWERVKFVEYVGQEPTVAITVPETHTYLTTFVEHNSFMAGILTNLFMGLYFPSRVAITGPTGKQTRSQVWNYISTVWSRSVFKDDIDWYRTTMSYKVDPSEWFATWLTSKEPKSIEGFHGPDEGKNLLWIVEESKGVADEVFEAIQGALSHNHNYWYISSTCGTGSGFFFDTFHSKKELWENVSVPYYESSRISPQQVRKWEKTWGKDSSIFKARVLAEFPEEDDKIIVPHSWLQRAIVRNDDDDDDDDSSYNHAA